MTNLKGFTLVEVLVALLIVSLVFLSSFLSLSEMTRNSESLKEKTFASIVASNLMTQIQLGLIRPNESRDTQVVMAGQTYRWQLNKSASPFAGTEQVNIEITNNKGNGIYTLNGYVNAKEKR